MKISSVLGCVFELCWLGLILRSAVAVFSALFIAAAIVVYSAVCDCVSFLLSLVVFPVMSTLLFCLFILRNIFLLFSNEYPSHRGNKDRSGL